MYPNTVNNPEALMRTTLYNPTVTSNCKPVVQSMQRKQSEFSFSCCWLPELRYINGKWLTFHSTFWNMNPNMLARDSENFIQELLTVWGMCLKTVYQIPPAKQSPTNQYPTALFNWGLCRHRRSCSCCTVNGQLILTLMSLTLDMSWS